jgi:hypothetical protein
MLSKGAPRDRRRAARRRFPPPCRVEKRIPALFAAAAPPDRLTQGGNSARPMYAFFVARCQCGARYPALVEQNKAWVGLTRTIRRPIPSRRIVVMDRNELILAANRHLAIDEMPPPKAATAGALELRDVGVAYGDLLAVSAVSGSFAAGSLTAVVRQRAARHVAASAPHEPRGRCSYPTRSCRERLWDLFLPATPWRR